MAANSAALSPDDIIAAFSKPAPGDEVASVRAAAATPDDIIRAFSKPAPAPPSAPDPEGSAPLIDPRSGIGVDWSVVPQAVTAANDAARSANAWVADKTAPLRPPGDTALGPNATAADIPPDSPAGQVRMGVTLSAPQQDIDPQATFEALSARRNKLLAAGVDPKTDPEYVALLRQQATAIAQNNQAGAMFLLPGGALEGGAAGIVARGVNRLAEGAAPEAAVNRLGRPEVAPAAPAAPAVPPAPVQPAFNAFIEPPPVTAGAPVAAPRYNLPPASNRLAAPPEAPAPVPTPTGEPVPQSAGAAATPPEAVTVLTPAQIARYQASAEGRKLLETQPVGVPDTTQYVPGVSASTAEVEQTVNAAREAKAANVAHEEVSQTDKEIAEANSERRKDFAESLSGDKVTTGIVHDERDAQATADLKEAFGGEKGVADTAPVSAAIRDTLSTPRGLQNDELQGYLKPLLKRLENADGTPKILDPEELYGFREQVNKMLSSASKRKDPGLEHVSGQIKDLIPVIDKAIEDAAPGYRKYMDNYASASKIIDEQEILQSHLPKLFDAQNRMTYNKVQTMMRQIVDARSARGLNPYKSISDGTMADLWNLRDDLRRSASAKELARTPGSDTTQTALDVAKHLGVGAARLGVHAAANAVAPVLGSLAVNTGEQLLNASRAAKAKRAGVERGLQNLNPNRLVPRRED